MKLILLAAAVAFAVPAVAQTADAPPPADSQAQTPDQAAPDPAAAGQSTADQAAMPASPDAATPAGGYEPAAPPMSAPAQPGATVVFQPSAAPSTAFPPPAPLAHYPVCKRGQTDQCMEPHSLK